MKRSTKNPIVIVFLLCSGTFSSLMVFGQGKVDTTSAYMWFDEMIGQTNSGIFRGVAYKEEYRVINEKHHFFKEPYFVTGSLIYGDQPYYNVKLRYDVYNDQLSLQNEELERLPIMVFDKEKVSEFNMAQHRFKHLDLADVNGKTTGFFEVLLENDSLVLFKKYRKKRFKRTDAEVLYYEFKDHHTYHLKYGAGFYTLNKAKDLNGIFPEFKKELKAIRNRYGSLRNSDSEEYMKAILLEVYSLLSAKNAKAKS